MSEEEAILVDPRNYRSFCFRGEGRANLVISAKGQADGNRIVWRFSKARKSGNITVKAKSALVNDYMEVMVRPFFSESYLVAPRIIQMNAEDVHILTKIRDEKVEDFEQHLSNDALFPECMSRLPKNLFQKGYRIFALEMVDATNIPKQIPKQISNDTYIGTTITVEIKPKQGFYQVHRGNGLPIPYCNNCILQLEKCGSDHFDEMYNFCPLDLFSGSSKLVQSSLSDLFQVPHRNLRLFVDGKLVHSNEGLLDPALFDSTLFPSGLATTDQLIQAIALVITGSESLAAFHLHPHSVLSEILRGQRIDKIGIVRAHHLYHQLDEQQRNELLDKSSMTRAGNDFLNRSDPFSLVKQYLLAATMKDCSIMVSMRVVPADRAGEEMDVVRISDELVFAHSVKIVDLDPKSPKNLLNAYPRFMAGVKIVQLDSSSLNECVI